MTLNENAQKQFDRELVKEYYGQARARGKDLTQEDFEYLINGHSASGFFTYSGLVRWLDNNLPYINSREMEIIKNDSNFFVNESRQPKGYIPLSARKNISLVAAFLGSESVEVALAQNVR